VAAAAAALVLVVVAVLVPEVADAVRVAVAQVDEARAVELDAALRRVNNSNCQESTADYADYTDFKSA